MSRRRWQAWALGTGVVVVPAGLLLWGWRVDGYLSDVLVSVGATAVVFAPLYWLERVLDRRLTRVEGAAEKTATRIDSLDTEVEALAAQLEDLTSSTKDYTSRVAHEDAAIADRFRRDARATHLHQLMSRAIELNAVEGFGVRVQIPGQWERLRFQPTDDSGFRVILESVKGARLSALSWGRDESALELIQRVVDELQRHDLYNDFDAADLMKQLVDILSMVIGVRRRGAQLNLAPIIEWLGQQWAVTLDGIECTDHHYVIDRNRLGDMEFRRHVGEKTWVDLDALDEAWHLATALLVTDTPDWLVDSLS